MDIAERFGVDATVERVWPLLSNIETVAECFPGAELTAVDEDGRYAGQIGIRFGPTTATFTGTASITIADADRSATIDARGKDKRGSSRASAHVQVRALEVGEATTVEVDGSIEINGPLAGFANAGGAHVTRVLLSDFATAIAARATSEPAMAGTAPARSVPSNAPLSLTELTRRSLSGWFRRIWDRVRHRGSA